MNLDPEHRGFRTRHFDRRSKDVNPAPRYPTRVPASASLPGAAWDRDRRIKRTAEAPLGSRPYGLGQQIKLTAHIQARSLWLVAPTNPPGFSTARKREASPQRPSDRHALPAVRPEPLKSSTSVLREETQSPVGFVGSTACSRQPPRINLGGRIGASGRIDFKTGWFMPVLHHGLRRNVAILLRGVGRGKPSPSGPHGRLSHPKSARPFKHLVETGRVRNPRMSKTHVADSATGIDPSKGRISARSEGSGTRLRPLGNKWPNRCFARVFVRVRTSSPRETTE